MTFKWNDRLFKDQSIRQASYFIVRMVSTRSYLDVGHSVSMIMIKSLNHSDSQKCFEYSHTFSQNITAKPNIFFLVEDLWANELWTHTKIMIFMHVFHDNLGQSPSYDLSGLAAHDFGWLDTPTASSYNKVFSLQRRKIPNLIRTFNVSRSKWFSDWSSRFSA